MELIHMFLNLVAPPITFFSLCFFLPPFLCFKFFISLLNSIFTTKDLTGKVVIITGASSGIGEHLAYEYASRGACLALCARREKSLEDVAETAREIGSPDVITVRGDVSKVDDCRRLVEETVDHFGRYHLVNNAGLCAVCMFEDSDNITNFKHLMDTNFWGSVYTTRFAVPYLRNTKGNIVALSSADAWLPMPRHSFYNASKAAMLSFFETLRVELGQDINVTIVTPGFIESELTQGKFLTRKGKVEVDQEMRDVQVSAAPIGSVISCAKAIVNSACRGERYLTEPSWFRVTYWLKVFCPEVIEWSYRLFYLTRPGDPSTEALSKRVLDFTGAKNVLYPTSIQSPDIKTE